MSDFQWGKTVAFAADIKKETENTRWQLLPVFVPSCHRFCFGQLITWCTHFTAVLQTDLCNLRNELVWHNNSLVFNPLTVSQLHNQEWTPLTCSLGWREESKRLNARAMGKGHMSRRIRSLRLLRSLCGQLRKKRQEPSLCHSHTLSLSPCLSHRGWPYVHIYREISWALASCQNTNSHTNTHAVCVCTCSVACLSLVCDVFMCSAAECVYMFNNFMVLTCRRCFCARWCVFFACMKL